MLGLRKGFSARRKRNSAASSIGSEGQDESTPARAAMNSIRMGLQETLSGVGSKPVKPADAASVTVSIVDSIEDSDKTASLHEEPTTANGHTHTDSSTVMHLARLPEVTLEVKKSICKLDDYDETSFEDEDLSTYLQYIADERLMHMPRKGSDWDRVLRTAQFFGLQIWSFGEKVGRFAPHSMEAATAAVTSCRVLLEVGHRQAQALLPTFMALYELGLLVSQVKQIPGIFTSGVAIKEDVGNLYCDLVRLTGSVSVFYRKRIDAMGSGSGPATTINFDAEFGKQLDAIWNSKTALCDRMWKMKLGNKSQALSLPALRGKLDSVSSSFRGALYSELAEDLERAEDTCEWIKHDLAEFLRSDEKVLTVTGPPGCGKTMLADWVEERLQRPLDRTSYTVLTYFFPFDSSEESTPLAFLKSLLSQMLEKSVGNVDLYECLVSAFSVQEKAVGAQKLELSLWKALQNGLQHFKHSEEPVVILVDGFEAVTGVRSAIDFHKSLRECVSKLKSVHAITFSRPVSHVSDGCRHITVTPQKNHNDIRSFSRQTLSRCSFFKEMGVSTRERFMEDLTQKSKGSFLWARLVSRLLTKAESRDAFTKSAESMSSAMDTVLHAVVANMDLKNDSIRNLLAFMLVADQPMAVENMAELLAVSVSKRTKSAPADLAKLVSDKCGDIAAVKDGRLRFRSSIIRSYLRELMGKSLPSAKEAHLKLTLRMLLYAKLSLEVCHEPSIDGLSDRTMDELFGSHRSLQYVMRSWVIHFRASSLCGEEGKLVLSQEFKEVFPASTTFSMLERACWHSSEDVTRRLDLTLHIRESCFGEKHTSVLQALINLGHTHSHFSQSDEATRFFYRASRLGQVVLSKFDSIVITCTRLLLTITETMVVVKRTEIVTYREEMIRFMIEVCKSRHGASSNEVIIWYERLATLYICIGEKHRAAIINRELYEIIVIRYGRHHHKAKELTEFFGGLDIVLKEFKEEDVKKYGGLLLETCEDLDVTDGTRISILLQLAYSYVLCSEWYLAETLYLSLWRRICFACRGSTQIEIHISKIQIALAYIKFLRKLKRVEEASSILICLWAEYEHHSFESETIIVYIREIGVMFKAFGLLSIAISVLTKVWGWFKSKGKTGGDEAQRTTILITEVVEEITETTTATKTTTVTTTEVTETVVKEIFETHFTRCKHTKVDKAFFSACIALVGIYLKQENWVEAEVIIKRSLEISWKAIFSAEIKISLTEHHISECIVLVNRLAVCYRRQRQFEQAEKLYLRIFYACLSTLSADDVVLTEALTVLIAFYEEHHRHERVLEIYIEVLAHYRKHLGAQHRLTIKMLYALAAHCELLGRREAYGYYIEIVTILNKGLKHCHHEAFGAAVILCRYYHAERQWSELQVICAALWESFLHHHGECGFTEDVITLIYEKYTYVLEVHAKVQFSILYKLSVEYRETVVKVFGVSSALVILAMIALAKMCERSEEHYHESVTIYEEVIRKITTTKTTTTTITETTVHTVKKRLSKMYVTIITTGRSGGSATTTTIERAIAICIEAYELLKMELGCWHETTLFKLRDIVILYQKLATQEARVRIVQLLQVSIVEIVTTLTVSIHLFEAATTLASIYVSCGMAKQGHDLLYQLRHLLVFRDSLPSSDITLRLDVKVSRVVFVFLASFEQGLAGKTVTTFAETMAGLLLEAVLYEEYTRVLERETRIEVVLETGAKLRCFWEEEKKASLLAVLDKRLFQLFKNKYGAHVKTHDDHTRVFFLALLAELGTDRAKVDFPAMCCRAGTARVRALLGAGDFKRAHEVARCAFQLAAGQRFYRELPCVTQAYKLAELLVGLDAPRSPDAKLAEAMLETSREITTAVLAALEADGVSIAGLRFADVAGLVRLLGRQGNYGELEKVLRALWLSREVQRSWRPATVLSVGRAAVHAAWAQGHTSDAIELCDVLWYNLRRGRGWLDPDTVRVAELLASLYVSAGRAAEATAVYDTVLREIDGACAHQQHHATGKKEKGGRNGYTEEVQEDRTVLKAHALLHLEMLRAARLRMDGGAAARGEREFRDLFDRLKRRLELQLPAFDDWAAVSSKDKGKSDLGRYAAPKEWRLEGDFESKPPAAQGCGKTTLKPPKRKSDVVQVAHQWWFIH